MAPHGGFFVWLQLPEEINSAVFLRTAEDAGVSYIPGVRFFTDGGGENHCRLNFTMVSLNELEEGAYRLGSALSQYRQ
jgi:DNA-binding transcriptional MocR family regulator